MTTQVGALGMGYDLRIHLTAAGRGEVHGMTARLRAR